ncbi:MAG: hypothetical protein ABTQ93_11405 [Candidatus Competibacter denitrificans]
MSDIEVDLDRRHLLAHLWRRSVLEPLADTARATITQTRQQLWSVALENELRAFGPDISAECARRVGVDPKSDYADVAAAIVVSLASDRVNSNDA